MPLSYFRSIVLAIVALYAFDQIAAQLAQAPPPPVAPTSEAECQRFSNQMEAYFDNLAREDMACGARENRYCSSQRNQTACYLARQAPGLSVAREHTQCGEVQYLWKACRSIAIQLVCAKAAWGQENNACYSEVRVYEQQQRLRQATRSTYAIQPVASATSPQAPRTVPVPSSSTVQHVAGRALEAALNGSAARQDTGTNDKPDGSARAASDIDAELTRNRASIDSAIGKPARHSENASANWQAETFVKASIDDVIHSSERQLEQNVRRAEQSLTGNSLARYLERAEQSQSVLRGLESLAKSADYAILVAAILDADSERERNHATGELVLQPVKEVTSSAVVDFFKTTFPDYAPVLEIGISDAFAAGGVLLHSTEERLDPIAVLNDGSARYTLEDKGQALFDLWIQFDRHGSSWSNIQKIELLNATRAVYEQSRHRTK